MADYKKRVLRYIFSNKSITRSQIAQALDIRKNTIGDICGELLEDGLILEADPSLQRNIPLSVNPSAAYAAGLEHRINELLLVIIDFSGNRIFEYRTKLEETDENLRLAVIARELWAFLKEAGIEKEKLLSIGFSDFVPHDIGGGLFIRSIWMPHWGAVDVRAALREQFGVSPCIIRCTDARSISEYYYGMARGWPTFLLVQLDQGVGLSVFKDGHYLSGTTDIFGEIGHTIYKEDGEICKCGNRGCLETVAGVSNIEKKFAEIQAGLSGVGSAGSTADMPLRDIVALSREGSKTASLVLGEAAEAIGYALANVVNVLGITDIILYGPLTSAGTYLTSPVESILHSRCLYPLNQRVQLYVSTNDDYAGAQGAAWKSLQQWYEKDN